MGTPENFHKKIVDHLLNNSRVDYKWRKYSYELTLFMDFIDKYSGTHNFPSPIFSMTYTKYIEKYLKEVLGVSDDEMKPIINEYYDRIKTISEKKSKYISYVREKVLEDTDFNYTSEILTPPTESKIPGTPFKTVLEMDVINLDTPFAIYARDTYALSELETKVVMDIYLSNIKHEVKYKKRSTDNNSINESMGKESKFRKYVVDDLIKRTEDNENSNGDPLVNLPQFYNFSVEWMVLGDLYDYISVVQYFNDRDLEDDYRYGYFEHFVRDEYGLKPEEAKVIYVRFLLELSKKYFGDTPLNESEDKFYDKILNNLLKSTKITFEDEYRIVLPFKDELGDSLGWVSTKALSNMKWKGVFFHDFTDYLRKVYSYRPENPQELWYDYIRGVEEMIYGD